MNLSAPFIPRPVGTALLTLAVALVGIVAFALLPVAPLPQIDFPTIRVQASLPGASPETMASTVATPLERTLGRIAGITEMTSQSSQGSVGITIQFELSRDIDGAARDVQAAINAARATLPTLPSNPTYRKMNPADAPIMVIGLTSDSLTMGELYDAASNIFSQKLSQVYGVGQVNVGGSSLPAVRVEVDPGLLTAKGLSQEDVRRSIASGNLNMPKGILDNGREQWTVSADDQLMRAADFLPLIISYRDGRALRLGDIARVEDGVQDLRNMGFAAGKPAIVLMLYKQPGANIIETVQRVRESLPMLRAWMPSGVDVTIIMDRSPSITESLREVERTLVISMLLVIAVVFLFLQNGRATMIPAVAVPVSLLGTFGIMYLLGYSLNHLSLMALTIATGFVVDDAIVVTENIVRHIENGASPLKAAFAGSREVAFTVMSMSLSLVAIFIPILGMGGLPGRLFAEFSVTLSVAVLVSLVVSLVTTPTMCAHILRQHEHDPTAHISPPDPGAEPEFVTPADDFFRRWRKRFRRVGRHCLHLWVDALDALHEGYARTLAVVLRHKFLTLLILLLTMGLNVYLYIIVPKGFFPSQDTGQFFGMIRGDQSISFQAMQPKMRQLMDIVRSHPAVVTVGGFTGGQQRNSGMVFITLKPRREGRASSEIVMAELRRMLSVVPGAELFLVPIQDLSAGGRRTRAAYQYTLQCDDLALLREWTPRVTNAIQQIPGLADVNSDQEIRGLQTNLTVDRDILARFGVTQRQVDTALGLAFGQSFASTIYTGDNQYRVVLEFAPEYLESPESLIKVYVPVDQTLSTSSTSLVAASGLGGGGRDPSVIYGRSNGTLVPLNAFSRAAPGLTSLSVSHQGQFTAATISFNLMPDVPLSAAQTAIAQAMRDLHAPEILRGSFQGTARAFAKGMDDQLLLILAALLTLYIVLGVLYESLIHPLTILSTLPSAGVGAILGLLAFKAEFTVIAFIGVLLLCGIVKKNAIMMVDFAIEARRSRGISAEEAIYEACLLRFRPIMMTTMAAVFGAIPLILGSGEGSELRAPLGITIVGGLLVSQLLTLYTTPVVYLYLDRFSRDSLMPKRKDRVPAVSSPAILTG